MIARDAQFVSPSYTRGYPLVAKSGRGAMVEDVDGNVFLDFAAGIAVVSTGHCHPRVVEAIQKQAAELIHISGTDFYLPNLVELAERLAAIAPGKEPKKVYFGNSGTEAIEAAIKLARYHTRRDKIIAFHGCFHGRTLGALSLTASKAVQRKGFGSLLAGRVSHSVSEFLPLPVRPSVAVRLRGGGHVSGTEIFKRLVDPQEVAAVFIEPIQGEGGYVPAPKKFLLELQRICRKHGILLVCRRSAERDGAHGKVVGRRSRGHRTGHSVRGQGNRVGHAAFGDDRAREPDGLEARRARLDVWRQSGVRRRGAGDDGLAGNAIH